MTPERIIEIVSDKFDVDINLIKSYKLENNRSYRGINELSDVRFAAIYFIRNYIKSERDPRKQLPLKKIGTYFSGQHHTTIIHAINKFKEYFECGYYDNNKINQIKKQIESEIEELEMKAFISVENIIKQTHFAA